jgi:putative flippase GtrA
MSAIGPQRGAWFSAVTGGVAARLPFGLNRVVPARLVGFAVISSITFPVDLGLLTAFHGGLRWPLPAAITAAYAIASSLGYALNRALNFRSHGALGPQLTVYAAVVTVNYLALILGVSTGLAALGLDYRLARVAAATCECVYMYSALRWLVFRDAAGPEPGPAAARGRAGAGPVPALTGRPHEDDAAPECRS